MTKGQIEVLKAFKTLGAVDDGALSAYVHHMSPVSMSSSGIRTRRAELEDSGYVAMTGEHKLKSGRRARIHSITSFGRKALRTATKKSKVTA